MRTSVTTVVVLAATLVAGDCAADNCLRALRSSRIPGRLNVAQAFCSAYSSDSTIDIPSFAVDACKSTTKADYSARISSACACIDAAATPTITSVAYSSSPTSISISSGPFTNTSIPATTPTPSAPLTNACAIVSSSSSVQKFSAPAATPTVAASLALECLTSAPLNKTAALLLVDAIEPYLEWQSDSAYKKDPPADYFYPAHDIFGYLASVKIKLQADTYPTEYAFQSDLYQVFARAHDGHFVMYPDLLTGPFDFARQRGLVSISEDGSSLPVIKIYEEVVTTPKTASVVKMINGVDAATYVADFAYQASFNQDADAAYNSMFFEKAFEAGRVGNGYFESGGRTRYIYPGDNTTFTFANGTVATFTNIALVKGNFLGVTDGSSLFKKFCANALRPTAEVSDTAEQDAYVPPVLAPGYPQPVVTSNDTIVSGYYLDGDGYQDVAVFSALAFESESIVEFQDVAQKFFADAVRDGKTKLVVDLSANGGGYILQGYDLFRQLFPDIIQDGNSRFRQNPYFLAIAESSSAEAASFNTSDPGASSDDVTSAYESFFNYRYDYNISNQPFESFDAKFGSHVYKDDKFTNLLRWNLNDPLTTSDPIYGLGTDVTGYGSRTNFTQPFKAENIIMLQDGYCASTCTLFAEFMRTQAGVRSVAMGGRPQTGPIQGVGGIKGSEILTWANIYSAAQTALELNNTTPEEAITLKKLSAIPINRALSSACNVRDNILPDNVNDGLPAQYVREEADCRLYYTESMITDVTALWKAVADAAFNGKACAAGSLPKRDAKVEAIHEVEKRAQALEEQIRPARREAVTKDSGWVARHGRKVIQ